MRIPIALLDDPEATHATVLVYAALARHANRHRQCWPSIATIAKEARVSLRTACRAIAWLDEAWYISRKARSTPGGRKSTLYTLLTPKVIRFPSPATGPDGNC